ncbi:MAG: EAL domain-containing protein [Steroidobacteraceae bacterium]
MRRPPVALFSGIGRHLAGAALVCGLAVLAAGLLLQAGKQQRHFRDMHQQQLRQAAVQVAALAQARIDIAALSLRAQLVPGAQQNVPMFNRTELLPAAGYAFRSGPLFFTLSTRERDALAGGGTVLLGARPGDGPGHLYLLRAFDARRWILAELNEAWVWPSPEQTGTTATFTVFDSQGIRRFTSDARSADIAGHVTSRLDLLPVRGAGDLAWMQAGNAWVGAMTRIPGGNVSSDLTLALVAMAPDRPWATAFLSALRTQSAALPLLLLLALWFAHRFATPHVRALRQLRRAILQLPERRLPVPLAPQLAREVRQLVEASNRTGEAIEAQQSMRRVLDEIDALLLPGGDYENVIDQVLGRVRAIAEANNVGLTLVDQGSGIHGRLFVVNAHGGAPVNRIVLDVEMVETLCEADAGLTIVRCEEGRHSFLEPLQSTGSDFFWVWPVMAGEELAAILAVGYVEPPAQAARIAQTGALCAQHLGLALSSNARAEQLYRQAHYDPLTQLPNRQLFREQLQHEINKGASGALLYIDLDHFKRVNDSLGHEAGDQLLANVAQRLRAAVRSSDTVARLGGDEFTVILREVDGQADVAAVAENIIGAMRVPMRLGGREHYVHASVGMALFMNDGASPDELLHQADLAMYRAKDLGRGAAVFYSASLGGRRALVADSGLYRAMKRREFSLYFQPQYRVADGALVGVEALLRWQKPRDGMQAPAEFIPAAEEAGIIVDLGGWVIEAACAQIAQWRDAGLRVPRMALNLSPYQLRDPELIVGLRRQMERYRVAPAALEFEMSEAALADPECAPGLEALAAIGVGITLDDFGTGSTALATLRRHPVGTVKIDRSFIDKLVDEPAAAALAGTIIVMAHSLNKRVIAEGVETIEQLDFLRDRSCDVAQGFFLAQPLSPQDMTELLLGRAPAGDTVRLRLVDQAG